MYARVVSAMPPALDGTGQYGVSDHLFYTSQTAQ